LNSHITVPLAHCPTIIYVLKLIIITVAELTGSLKTKAGFSFNKWSAKFLIKINDNVVLRLEEKKYFEIVCGDYQALFLKMKGLSLSNFV